MEDWYRFQGNLPTVSLSCSAFGKRYAKLNLDRRSDSGQHGFLVNTPPPKGGGFGLRLEAGLIDPSGRFSQMTLKLSSGSSGFFFQTSSVTFPLVATQYPRDRRC